jgi:16S rRNA (guanine527-N7)-methyltransferase
LKLSAKVHAERAELLKVGFGCVTLRAVDKMAAAVKAGADLVAPGGWLALMTTRSDLAGLQAAAGTEFSWAGVASLPGGEERVLALGQRAVSSPA